MNCKAGVSAIIFLCACCFASAQNFIHPGIDQTKGDLDYMKSLVLKGTAPYKAAYDGLKAAADTPFTAKDMALFYSWTMLASAMRW
jgi:hypothetical protein